MRRTRVILLGLTSAFFVATAFRDPFHSNVGLLLAVIAFMIAYRESRRVTDPKG